MSLLNYFSCPVGVELPQGFDSPFCNRPSALARAAALAMQSDLQQRNWGSHNFFADGNGQMFAVLVVRDSSGQLATLYGFAGQLGGEWLVEGFVPPAFDVQQREQMLKVADSAATEIRDELLRQRSNEAYSLRQSNLQRITKELYEQTQRLQKALVARKAERRVARASANAEQLVQLQRQGEEDARLRAQNKRTSKAQLQELQQQLDHFQAPIDELQQQLEQLNQTTIESNSASYTLLNGLGETADLSEIFAGRPVLPGIGDCASPKLLSYAYQQALQPVAMTEFWWGAAPKEAIRHHGHFYPACRGRCGPLLAFMLQGLSAGVQPDHMQPCVDPEEPAILYEDNHLLVINKPIDLLSVPGLSVVDSVQSRLQARHADMPELQLVHRLDQSTSGLLLVAKTRQDHKVLQRQFTQRSIQKRYVALLDGVTQTQSGEVDLPLRVDLEDRPRQLVCRKYGKASLTRWEVISQEGGYTRVALYPVTGRTHQLRMHMAHPRGLGLPILGDELYGTPGHRLHLHAEQLRFIHPRSGEEVNFCADAPF